MPVLDVEEKVKLAIQAQDGKAATYPLAGAQLLCPYCGWTYEPEQGCFCVRIEPQDKTANR